MPRYVKNSGMNSMSEIFAMKKNIAFQAKLEHRMHALNKDFFSKSENLRQGLRDTYDDLKDIRLSTGYSTDQVRSAKAQGRPPGYHVPRVYLPPIGVRLVKKYMGLDISKSKREGMGNQPAVTKSNVNTTESSDDSTPDRGEAWSDLKKGTWLTQTDSDSVRASNRSVSDARTNFGKRSDMRKSIKDEEVSTNGGQTQNLKMTSSSIESLKPAQSSQSSTSPKTDADEDTDEETFLSKTEMKIKNDQNLSLLAAHIPSRGRLTSVSSRASSIKISKRINFNIDYGDGKLHDMMEIPRVKDCSRTWCRVTCRTCKLRTTQIPCFLLVPVNRRSTPARKLPSDTRRPSLFPLYRGASKTEELLDDTDDTVVTGNGGEFESRKGRKKKSSKSDDRAEADVDTDGANVNDGLQSVNAKIASYVKRRGDLVRRGFSKRRINELAQPKDGIVPMVRFSTASLRRQAEELRENERTKQISEVEKLKLAEIQGKVSLFLAVFNLQETREKPVKMVDLPLREDITTPGLGGEMDDTPVIAKHLVRPTRRKVRFNLDTGTD